MDSATTFNGCPCGAKTDSIGPQGALCGGGHWSPRENGRIAWEKSDAPRRERKNGAAHNNGASKNTGDHGQASAGKGREPTQAQRIAELAKDVDLFRSQGGEGYAAVEVNGHWETHSVRSTAFRRWLEYQFWHAYQSLPSAQAKQDALDLIDAKARFGGIEQLVATRIARADGAYFLDLANERWEAVRLTAQGWDICKTVADVAFRRARGVAALPRPEHGGSVVELRRFLNVAGADDWILLLTWLVAALRPIGPYPILVLHGEQGAAKSTTARVLRALVDPNDAPLRAEPRDARDLMITAKNAHVLAYDNLSRVPGWLSDALCRLSTGGGFATRELYSNDEEAIFNAQRPVILTGIEELATRADLLDRSLILYLPTITDEERRPEAAFWRDFEAARPRILGALLDAVCGAMGRVESVSLDRLPRMADFALWASAAEPFLGCASGAFLSAYAGNREAAHELSLEASPIASVVQEFAQTEPWEGTATALLLALNCLVTESVQKSQTWPKDGRTLSNRLRRIAPNLRALGITVTFAPGRRRGRLICLEKGAGAASPASPASSASSNLPLSGDIAASSGGTFASPEDAEFPSEDAKPSLGDAGDAKLHQYSAAVPMDPWDGLAETDADGLVRGEL